MKKELYERILDLRNRISLDGDDTIYEEDYLLLDEVLDLIENIGGEDTDIETQIYDYNNTVDIYNELEMGVKFKKQEKLLELYKKLVYYYGIDEFFNKFTNTQLKELYKKQIKELENEINL